MNRFLTPLLFLLSFTVCAQSVPNASFSGVVDLSGNHNDWSLTEKDWERYLTLMKGPSGLLYRNMSPFYVLGINEQDSYKQREYAERSLNLHETRFKRMQQFFNLQRSIAEERILAMQAASESVEHLLKRPPTPDELANNGKSLGDHRLSLYTAIHDCEACDRVASRILKRGNVDIYFIDAANDDEIRTWALENGVDPLSVQQEIITLNNDRQNVFASLGATRPPVLFRQTAEPEK